MLQCEKMKMWTTPVSVLQTRNPSGILRNQNHPFPSSSDLLTRKLSYCSLFPPLLVLSTVSDNIEQITSFAMPKTARIIMFIFKHNYNFHISVFCVLHSEMNRILKKIKTFILNQSQNLNKKKSTTPCDYFINPSFKTSNLISLQTRIWRTRGSSNSVDIPNSSDSCDTQPFTWCFQFQ